MKFNELLFYWKEIGKGTANFHDISHIGSNKEDFLKEFKNETNAKVIYRDLDVICNNEFNTDKDILDYLQSNCKEFESGTSSFEIAELFASEGFPGFRYYLILEMEAEKYLELKEDDESEIILYRPVYKKILRKHFSCGEE